MTRARSLLSVVLILVVAPAVSAVLAQTRTTTAEAADVAVEQVQVQPLPDGGCVAVWAGSVVDSDGDTQRTATQPAELTAAANRNACNTLLTAGRGRVGRALKFPVDAGRP